MKITSSLIILLPLFLAGCTTQSELSQNTSSENLLNYSEFITPDFLRSHLEIIAHDSLEGRATGTKGQKMAADYLASYYDRIGLKPMGDDEGYFQYYKLQADYTDSLIYETFRIENGDTIKINRSVESDQSESEYIRLFGGSQPLSGDIIFAGFGLNDPENEVFHLEGEDLHGKWVLIFEEIPYEKDGETLISPSISSNSRMQSILAEKDAAGILLISDYTQEEFEELAEVSSALIGKPTSMSLDYLVNNRSSNRFPKGFKQISPEMASMILGIDKTQSLESVKSGLVENLKEFRARNTSYQLEYVPYDGPGFIETENVIAFLEGNDPKYKDELLVIMGHYDHIGITQPDDQGDAINNGADDNGSGTVALLAIANAFQEAANDGFRPKRSILFLHVSGEENGLLGSRYYSDHPVLPIEKTVANFNTDMVGRSDPHNIENGDTDYVYLIGGEIISSGLDSLVQSGNRKSVNMRLDRRYNDLQDPNQFYRRSDHWNFGRLEVPFVFFFTGVHEDYHRPSDSADKIDYQKLSRVAKLIYSSAVEVTNFEGRPVVDNEEFIEITKQIPR